MAPQGVVVGRHQLGIRVEASDTRLQTRPSVWRIDRVPKGWHFQDLCELLDELHFQEVEVLEKQWRRNCASWLVRAKKDCAESVLQPVVPNEDGAEVELCISKEARRRQNLQKTQQLKQESRISFPLVRLLVMLVKGPRGTLLLKKWPDLFHADEQDADIIIDQTKRQRINEPVAEENSQKNSYKGWMPRRGTRVPNDGRGDCLFHAVQQALADLPKKQRSARQLRAFIVAFMRKHAEEYEALWDRLAPGHPRKAGDDDWNGTFFDYLDGLQIAGCWATYLECFALAASLNRTLLILTNEGEVWAFDNENGNAAICLYFDSDVGHYEFLLGPVEEELRQWAKQHSGRTGNVGCGGGRGSSSPKSVQLSDFASDIGEEVSVDQVTIQDQNNSNNHLLKDECDIRCDLSDFATAHDSLHSPAPNRRGTSRCLSAFATPPRRLGAKIRIWGKQSGRKAGFVSTPTSFGSCGSPKSEQEVIQSPTVSDGPNPRIKPKPLHPYFRRGSQFVQGSSKALQWNCPHCPFVFEGDSSIVWQGIAIILLHTRVATRSDPSRLRFLLMFCHHMQMPRGSAPGVRSGSRLRIETRYRGMCSKNSVPSIVLLLTPTCPSKSGEGFAPPAHLAPCRFAKKGEHIS